MFNIIFEHLAFLHFAQHCLFRFLVAYYILRIFIFSDEAYFSLVVAPLSNQHPSDVLNSLCELQSVLWVVQGILCALRNSTALALLYDTISCFYTFGSFGSDLSFGSGPSGLIGFSHSTKFLSLIWSPCIHLRGRLTFSFPTLQLLGQMLLKALVLVRREERLTPQKHKSELTEQNFSKHYLMYMYIRISMKKWNCNNFSIQHVIRKIESSFHF